jgi:hypothetical protein
VSGGSKAGEALRQHRLAGAGRPHQQQAVAAGCGDLQRPLGGGLALYVAQVRHGRIRRRALRRQHRQGGVIGLRLQRGHHVQQVPGAAQFQALHQRRLAGALQRQHQRAAAGAAPGRRRHGQRAAHRAQVAGQ